MKNYLSILSLLILMACSSEMNYHKMKRTIYHTSKKVHPILPKMALIKNQTIISKDRTITIRGFYISQHEITNSQFAHFLNATKNSIKIDEIIDYQKSRISLVNNTFNVKKGFENYPVNFVSYFGAEKYCEWLTTYSNNFYIQKGKFEKPRFRLPSYEEWYASSIITKDSIQNHEFVGKGNPFVIAWFKENSENILHEVGQKKPYQKLYDLNGNVSEWCEYDDRIYDFMGRGYHEILDSTLAIGGNFNSTKEDLNPYLKKKTSKQTMSENIGFRIVQRYMGKISDREF